MITGVSFDMLCMQHHNSDPQVAYFVWAVITIFTNYESLAATPTRYGPFVSASCICYNITHHNNVLSYVSTS
jgi:hypothetical protein